MTETRERYDATTSTESATDRERLHALNLALAGATKAVEGAEEFRTALEWYFKNHDSDRELYDLFNMLTASHARGARNEALRLLHERRLM